MCWPTRVVDDVFGAVDVESIVQTVLPSQASALAPALVAVLQRYAVQLVDDVIQSHRFQRAWVTANRSAHTQLVKLLHGELIPSQTTDRVNEVVLDLQGVVDQLRTKLAVVGIELPRLDVSQTQAGQFVVAKRAQLDSIRQAVDLLDRLAFVLPIVMLVLFLLAIWLSANRARTIMWIGLGSLLALGVLAVVLRYVRRDVLGRISDDLTRSAVDSIWRDVFSGLRVQVAVVAVLALVVAFAGWFLGGSRAATWGRRAVERDLGARPGPARVRLRRLRHLRRPLPPADPVHRGRCGDPDPPGRHQADPGAGAAGRGRGHRGAGAGRAVRRTVDARARARALSRAAAPPTGSSALGREANRGSRTRGVRARTAPTHTPAPYAASSRSRRPR